MSCIELRQDESVSKRVRSMSQSSGYSSRPASFSSSRRSSAASSAGLKQAKAECLLRGPLPLWLERESQQEQRGV